MPEPKPHLDADDPAFPLKALLECDHFGTRAPTPGIPRGAADERQLLGATAQGRCIFTFNVQDFLALAKQHPQHGGIVLAAQESWTLTTLIESLDRLLSETDARDWPGRVQWLE